MSTVIFKKGDIINADEFNIGIGCLIPTDCYLPCEDAISDDDWEESYNEGYINGITDYHIMTRTVEITYNVKAKGSDDVR